MKKEGTVIKFNGLFGIIKVNDENFPKEKVSFIKNDLVSSNVNEGDRVEFRVEKREPNLFIARNVMVKKK